MANTQPMPTAPMILQNAQTTGNGGVLMLNGNVEQLNIFLFSSGTTSGGAVSIEEAYWDPNQPMYAGTWSVIAAVNASTFTGGASVMLHYPGGFWAVRVRISSNITGGGSISAVGWGS